MLMLLRGVIRLLDSECKYRGLLDICSRLLPLDFLDLQTSLTKVSPGSGLRYLRQRALTSRTG